jgi:hypothetical protein
MYRMKIDRTRPLTLEATQKLVNKKSAGVIGDFPDDLCAFALGVRLPLLDTSVQGGAGVDTPGTRRVGAVCGYAMCDML